MYIIRYSQIIPDGKSHKGLIVFIRMHVCICFLRWPTAYSENLISSYGLHPPLRPAYISPKLHVNYTVRDRQMHLSTDDLKLDPEVI
jgi:hypothetical protein